MECCALWALRVWKSVASGRCEQPCIPERCALQCVSWMVLNPIASSLCRCISRHSTLTVRGCRPGKTVALVEDEITALCLNCRGTYGRTSSPPVSVAITVTHTRPLLLRSHSLCSDTCIQMQARSLCMSTHHNRCIRPADSDHPAACLNAIAVDWHSTLQVHIQSPHPHSRLADSLVAPWHARTHTQSSLWRSPCSSTSQRRL